MDISFGGPPFNPLQQQSRGALLSLFQRSLCPLPRWLTRPSPHTRTTASSAASIREKIRCPSQLPVGPHLPGTWETCSNLPHLPRASSSCSGSLSPFLEYPSLKSETLDSVASGSPEASPFPHPTPAEPPAAAFLTFPFMPSGVFLGPPHAQEALRSQCEDTSPPGWLPTVLG